MQKIIIFDLSEVIISGLLGAESELFSLLNIPEEQIQRGFWGNFFEELMLGNIEEERYLREIIVRENWAISIDEIKKVIRKNFHNEVPGVITLIGELADKYDLYLLSDHSREWIEYINSVHPFMKIFRRVFFSYELKMVKKNPAIFPELIRLLGARPEDCLFIDDHQINVDNARLAGIDAIRFKDIQQLRQELVKRNL